MLTRSYHSDFVVDRPYEEVYQLCLKTIENLRWAIRHDMTSEDRIACYVPIPDLLPRAPVYFVSLTALDDASTHVAVLAADDDLSQEHARTDLPQLEEALTGPQLPGWLSQSMFEAATISEKFTVEMPLSEVLPICQQAVEELQWQVERTSLTPDGFEFYMSGQTGGVRQIVGQGKLHLEPLSEYETSATLVGPDLQQTPARLERLRNQIVGHAVPRVPEKSAAPVGNKHIFISYRREDSADVSGRIFDRLVAKYGHEQVFKDVNDIPLGSDFRQILGDAIQSCDLLLAVVGRDWVLATDSLGQRRLDNPADFVRIEIESALEQNIPIIPLLVRGASMPGEDELPSSLRDFVYRNGIPIRSDPDFHTDVDRLIRGIDSLLQPNPTGRS